MTTGPIHTFCYHISPDENLWKDIEETIERIFERQTDRLDAKLMRDELTQAQYDGLSSGLHSWLKKNLAAVSTLSSTVALLEHTPEALPAPSGTIRVTFPNNIPTIA